MQTPIYERKDISVDAGRDYYSAVSVAKPLGLEVKIFPFSELLPKIGEDQEFIQRCAEETGTEFNEQLKFALISDASLDRKDILAVQKSPNVVIGTIPSGNQFDYEKVIGALMIPDKHIWNLPSYKTINPKKFSNNGADPEACGFEPGFIGLETDVVWHPHFFPSDGYNYDDYVDGAPTPYVIDDSIRDLTKMCFPIGRKAEGGALLLVDAGEHKIGEKLDEFLNSYLKPYAFVIDDIKKE